MEFIRTSKGKLKLCYEGYMYTQHKQGKKTIRWVCVKKNDFCKGTIKTNLEYGELQIGNNHDHNSSQSDENIAKIWDKNNIKRFTEIIFFSQKIRMEVKIDSTGTDKKPTKLYAEATEKLSNDEMARFTSEESLKEA